ncbi:MAG: group II truncated hemoglobin [Nevskia sp.]|nr:group II truncated hemoglobin [Nevskia sp.]
METTPYEMLGGETGVRRLAEAFYDAMVELPEAADLRALHNEDLSGIKRKLFEYLSGWLGGPMIYFEKYGGVCIRSVHARFPIGAAERDQWLLCMREAMRRVNAPPQVAALLDLPFARMAEAMRNRA